jgi:processive 1,2-diacylglycerol beta-glucosyltransferase
MLDVLILSANYGGGHRQAALALSKSLAHLQDKLRIEIVDLMEMVSPAITRFTRFTYTKSVRNTPSLYGYFYRVSDNLKLDSLLEKRLTNIGLEKILDCLAERSPRLIVSTYPVVAGVVSSVKQMGLLDVPLVTVITDNAVHSQWVHAETDLYLVGSEQVRQGLIYQGVPDSRIAITGIPIDPKFAQAPPRQTLYAKFGLDPDIPVLLVMIGAEGLLRRIPALCQLLDEFPLPLQVLVVTGKDRGLYQHLSEQAGKFSKPFQVYQFVDNVEEFMAVSNLLITKAGGLTISEALAVGLPMIIYRPIPGQEAENTRYLVNAGAALPVYNLKELKVKLHLILTQKQFYEAMRARAMAAGCPEAASIAAGKILSLLAGEYPRSEPASEKWEVRSGKRKAGSGK